MRHAGLFLLLLAAGMGGCRDAWRPDPPHPWDSSRLGVTPGVFVLANSVSPDLAKDLLNREVVPLESGGVGIVLTGPVSSNNNSRPQPLAASRTVSAFDSLPGRSTITHQTAHLVERTQTGALKLLEDSRIHAMETSQSQTSHIDDQIEHFVSGTEPQMHDGSAYVHAVASASRFLCTGDSHCTEGEFRNREVVALMVAGVGGPPGTLDVEPAPDCPTAVVLSLRAHPWVRVVVHATDASGAAPVLLWSMSRYDTIRAVPPHRMWAHPNESKHGLQPEFEPLVYRTIAPLRTSLDPAVLREFRVTYLDWRVPEPSASTLVDWDAWTEFLDNLRPGLARRATVVRRAPSNAATSGQRRALRVEFKPVAALGVARRANATAATNHRRPASQRTDRVAPQLAGSAREFQLIHRAATPRRRPIDADVHELRPLDLLNQRIHRLGASTRGRRRRS